MTNLPQTPSMKSPTLKPILRAAQFCGSVKQKVVHFCEEFNRVLLITPRQILRRSQRNKKNACNETFDADQTINNCAKPSGDENHTDRPFEKSSFSMSSPACLDLSEVSSASTLKLPEVTDSANVTKESVFSESEYSSLNESYILTRAQKISNRLRKAVSRNNQRVPRTLRQREYYSQVRNEVERRVTGDSKKFSMMTVYNYLERISLVETELWSDVFMPTKPFLTDINNDITVLFIQWLRVYAARLFKNNKINKRGQSKYKIYYDPDFEQIAEDKTKCAKEQKVTVLYGSTGAGKTQLVHCSAEYACFEVIEFSTTTQRGKQEMSMELKKIETDLAAELRQHGQKEKLLKLPLILIDDADVYFEEDKDYMQNLKDLIKNSKLPLVLTVSNREFALDLCSQFDESKIQLLTLNHTLEELIFQVQHFVSSLFVFDVDKEEISKVIEAANLDMRATLNILQFIYLPIIMRPFSEIDLPDKLFELTLPSLKVSQSKVNIRSLAEFQYDIYRNGLMKSSASNDSFIVGLGYVDKNDEGNYAALNDIYTEMFYDMAFEFEESPYTAADNSMDKKWW